MDVAYTVEAAREPFDNCGPPHPMPVTAAQAADDLQMFDQGVRQRTLLPSAVDLRRAMQGGAVGTFLPTGRPDTFIMHAPFKRPLHLARRHDNTEFTNRAWFSRADGGASFDTMSVTHPPSTVSMEWLQRCSTVVCLTAPTL